jgi:hypothetical protein
MGVDCIRKLKSAPTNVAKFIFMRLACQRKKGKYHTKTVIAINK